MINSLTKRMRNKLERNNLINNLFAAMNNGIVK